MEGSDPHFSEEQCFPPLLFLRAYDVLLYQTAFLLHPQLPDGLQRLHLTAHPVSGPAQILPDLRSPLHG